MSWNKLFEVALTIKEARPWEQLWDTDLIVILLPGHEEPFYCSTLGMGGECLGVVVYPGVNAFEGYRALMESDGELPPHKHLELTDTFALYLGDREELTPKERQIIRDLGYKFRGHNDWIYFRRMKPGYYPWSLADEEVTLLTEVLQNYVMALKSLFAGKIKVNFEAGEILFRHYSAEKKLWMNFSAPLPALEPTYPRFIVNDDLFLARLKKGKKGNGTWEMDSFLLPSPVQEKRNDTPFFPRCVLLVEHESGLVIGQELLSPQNETIQAILHMLDQAIAQFGRPRAIYTASKPFIGLLADLCEKIGVSLITNKGVPYIDECEKDMSAFMDGETIDLE